MSLVLGISAGVSGALLGAWSRSRRPPPLAEAVPRSTVAALTAGRFAVRGRVVPVDTEPSTIDGARCVFVERVQRVPGALGRSLDHVHASHRFFLEDETGRIEVDPSRTYIESSTILDESAGVAERRIRAGEEIELVCELRAAGARDSSEALALGYRDGAHDVEIDYDARASPAILRDTVDTGALDLDAHPVSRAAAGAAGAALCGWGLVLVLWAAAFATP